MIPLLRQFRLRSLLMQLGAGLSLATALLAEDRPNVIIIISDDQSPMAEDSEVGFEEPLTWGAYGGNTLTPHFDRIAAEGMLFTDANVPSSVCSPSRYALLTGRHPGRCTGRFFETRNPRGRLSQIENNVDLEADRNNLPRTLQAAGYRTGFVGKAHLINHELLWNTHRWEEFGLETYAMDADPRDPTVVRQLRHNQAKWTGWVKEQGFDFAEAVYPANLRELFNTALNIHNVEWNVRAVQRFIDQSKDEPFFLYFATTVPHGPDPWLREEGKLIYSMDADPTISPVGPVEAGAAGMPSRAEIVQQVTNAGLPRESSWITWLDAGIGTIMDRLERHGIADQTIVIVMSDHGAWRFGKTTLHEGGIRIPLVVRWPAQIAAGSTYDGLVSSLDITPTILAAAGIDPPADLPLDGNSFLPAFSQGDDFVTNEYIFGEVGYFRSIKTKKWKYISMRHPAEVRERMKAGETFPEWRGEPRERPYSTYNSHLGYWASTSNPHYFDLDQLYDLESDPREEHNLAWEKPGVLFDLQDKLAAFLRTFPDRPYGEFTTR